MFICIAHHRGERNAVAFWVRLCAPWAFLGFGGVLLGLAHTGVIGGFSLMLLGLLPLFLCARSMPIQKAAAGGLCWGAGCVAAIAAAAPHISELPAALPLLPALTAAACAAMAALTRRFGFQPVLITIVWMMVEAIAIATGALPNGLLSSAGRDYALLGAAASGLGSLGVAAALTMLTAGVIVLAEVASRRFSLAASHLPPRVRLFVQLMSDRVPWGMQCRNQILARGPPSS